MKNKDNKTFITHACNILADTKSELTGTKICKILSEYAAKYCVELAYTSMKDENGKNMVKRDVLTKNLEVFSPEQRYAIIHDLCNLDLFKGNEEVTRLKNNLIKKCPNIAQIVGINAIDEKLIEETKHWLKSYPEVYRNYQEAITDYSSKIRERGILDNLRLALELLLKSILNNDKSIENQLSEIGKFMKSKQSSSELQNMLVKLIDYYSKYQNTYVKHNNAVNENEIEIIFELTSTFMKFFAKLDNLNNTNKGNIP